ncbi:MAG: helix-turn-helix domain-containing GNAT family N-acetyltransferase [Pseudomonadota bacterium]
MTSDAVVRELRRTSRKLVRELGVVGGRHPAVGCTLTEGHVLLELDDAGSLTVGELAERLALDKSTTSRAVAALARRRLVTHRANRSDRRRKQCVLTANGRKQVTRIHEEADQRVHDALELLGDDEPERILTASLRYARALSNARRARGYRLRAIARSDNAELLTLIREVRDEHRHIVGADAPLDEPDEHDLARLYSRPRSHFVVIESANGLVGGGGFSPLAGGHGDTCELQRMYFRPEIRGLGLGFRLLRRCLDKASDFGFEQCYAETMAGMDRANALYSKAGFEPLDKPLGATGHTFTDAWLVKRLRPA